jgi:hypothetical protein
MPFNVLVTEASAMFRWTADAGSARSGAVVLMRLCTIRRLRVVGPVFFVLLTAAFTDRIDHHHGLATRLTWAAVYAAAYTLLLVLVSALANYVQARRSLATRLRAGTELTADWGDDSVVLSQPLAQTRIPLTAISRVRRLGEWTAFQQPGSKAWSVWPAPLFPPDEVARIDAG